MPDDDLGPIFRFSSPFTTFEVSIIDGSHFTLELQQRAFLRYAAADIVKHHPSSVASSVALAFNQFFHTSLPTSTIDTRRRLENRRPTNIFRKLHSTTRSIDRIRQQKTVRAAFRLAAQEARDIGLESAIQSTASTTMNSTHRRNMEIRAVARAAGVSSHTRSLINSLHPGITHRHEGSIYTFVHARAAVRF